MSGGSRYLLEPVLAARRAAAAAAEGELARAQAELERARESAEQAARALAAHEAERPRLKEAGDVLSGAALQRAAAFAARASDAARTLRQARDMHVARVRECEAEVERRRSALAEAHAAVEVIERDRARFEQAARQKADHREQLEADDHRPAIRGDHERDTNGPVNKV